VINIVSNGTGIGLPEWVLNGTIEGPSISADGRLGLGVSNPVQALEVAGNMIVNGTVSSQSTTFRNVLYNGDMRINQRGISTTVGSPTAMGTSSTAYALDRWLCYRGSYAGGANMSQGTMTSVDLPYQNDGLVNFLRIGRSVGDTSTTQIIPVNALETRDSIRLAGKYVTMSFYYRTGAALAGYLLSIIAPSTGTDQNFSSVWAGPAEQGGVLPSSTSWTKYSFSAQIPLNATQVAVRFGYTPTTNPSVANDYFDVTGVQLEKGTVATPFEVRPFATELALCQRYYHRTYNNPSNSQFTSVCGFTVLTSTTAQGIYKLPVTMRSNVISSTYSFVGPNFASLDWENVSGLGVSGVSVTTAKASPDAVTIIATVSGATAGQVRYLVVGGGGYIDFSAEL
jgi:hypothetical protein